jgi:hypothetical protein
MSFDRKTLRARAARYREKAAELRGHIERSPGLKHDFAKLAAEYEHMADQLDATARDPR